MQESLQVYEEKMNKTLESLERDYNTIRAGRANPRVLDRIRVNYYGTLTPIQQVGNVSIPEARMILIHPWEKSLLKDIERAILTSDLGINPTNDGNSIRLVFPELTEERRKELVKVVGKAQENAKVAIRNTRREANDFIKKMEKDKELSEDERKSAEEEVQKLTDRYIEEVDKITREKEEELMEI